MRILKTILLILTVCIAGILFLRPGAPKEEPTSTVADLSPSSIEPAPAYSLPVVLIRSGEETDVPWTSRTPAAKRVRKIFPDPAWMTPEPVLKAGDLITLALFDDAVFNAKISNATRYPNGGVGMTAHLQDGQNGTVYLSYFDGRLTASVETAGGADFSVECLNGTHYAVEIDRANSDVLEGAEPKVPPAQDAATDAPIALGGIAYSAVPGAPEGATIVDVMFVYTPAAKSWAATNNGIVNIINSAMQLANEAHTNSNTQVYLNMVHSEEVNYTEQGIYTDLNNLTFTGSTNSAMDEVVQVLRDQYKADLVCLLEQTEEAGGLGWLLNDTNGTPSYAFCVARVQQSRLTYTVVHEWGHNMGCHHSKTQISQPGTNGLYSYSSGWQWDDTLALSVDPYRQRGYCTVMTYEDANNDRTNEYIRVARFSNPTNYYIGNSTNATGTTNANNALTIRNTRAVIAAYRKAPDLDYDGLPNEWELQYFGGETNADPTATASNGVNTVLEAYIAGLNPTNAASFFKVNTFETSAVSSNRFVIGWNATSGRVYSINWNANLSNSFQPLATNIVWPQASYTDTVHVAEPRSFYKINVRLAP